MKGGGGHIFFGAIANIRPMAIHHHRPNRSILILLRQAIGFLHQSTEKEGEGRGVVERPVFLWSY